MHSMRSLFLRAAACCSLVPIFLLSASLFPQSAASSRPPNGAAIPVAWATRVDRAPKLDGTLDDPVWAQAKVIDGFLEREPSEGQPPSERTEVRILFTQRAVYFGIACYDSSSGSIVATELRRDLSQQLDDFFEILIDSSHNGRNAYVFQINPLGTQRDALIADEAVIGDGADDGDPGWDGVWTSEARVTAKGWTATVAIPFATLNFMQSGDIVWGINFKRFIRSKNEEDLWSSWRRVDGAHRISQAGELHGIAAIGSGRLFVVKPYALTGFNHFPRSAAGTGLQPGLNALGTGGVDVKLGLRSNLVANLTANTDFADADVDAQQFNLTPYKLFFPEKRQFFLENAGVFSFSLGDDSPDLLFFSRQIGIDPNTAEQVPVNGGAKVTGTLGRFELGLMDVNTRASGPNPSANFAVTRVKRSLWSGSYLGVMGIDKRSGNSADSFNQEAGADARLVFFKHLILDGFAAQTRTPGVSRGQTSEGAGIQYKTNWIDIRGHERKIGPNFNPETGFLSRTDCICQFVDLTLKARPKRAGIREIDLDNWVFEAPNTHHVLETYELENELRILFDNGAVSDNFLSDVSAQRLRSPFNVYKAVSIPAGEYRWNRHQISYSSPQDRRLTVGGGDNFGGYYNGKLNEAKITAALRASPQLSFQLIEQWNRFQLPVRGGNFSVLLGSLQSSYSFSRFLTLSSLLQMNTANTLAASSNTRLRWNYRPDSDLYVIYTTGQQFVGSGAQFEQNRLAIKLTYSWRP